MHLFKTIDRDAELYRWVVKHVPKPHIYVEPLAGAISLFWFMLKPFPSVVGWGQFLTFLQRKAAAAGRKVVAVNPANTSQLCSGCGQIVPKKLSDRWHLCPHCGTSLGRDHNAAINILRLAGQLPLFRAGQVLRALSRSLSDLPENPLALAMGSVKCAKTRNNIH